MAYDEKQLLSELENAQQGAKVRKTEIEAQLAAKLKERQEREAKVSEQWLHEAKGYTSAIQGTKRDASAMTVTSFDGPSFSLTSEEVKKYPSSLIALSTPEARDIRVPVSGRLLALIVEWWIT